MPLQSSLLHVGMAKETTQGTAVVPSIWFPVQNNVKNEDINHWIEDKGLMGAPVDPIAQYPGPTYSEVDFDANFYPDALGAVLMGMMGVDTVTGSAAPYAHALSLASGQPPSYTLSVYNGFNERQYPGCLPSEVQLKYATDGPLIASTKWTGFPSAVGTTSTPTLPTLDPFLGWEATLQIAAAANTRLIGFELTAKRSTKAQNTASGSQAPTFVYAGPLAVEGKLTFAVDDDTELTYLLSNTQPATTLTLTAASGDSLAIQMSKCAFSKTTPSYTKEWVEVDYDIKAMPNSTDAGASGPISPVLFTLSNGQQTSY
ncbi:phage tail tube protein [Alicyclobacillus sp. SO9]|uniref:phage tail tube protein n=1 Tax=Alicyclobacillus sp. SO9 TaxID=2665646 RepID=UPI0018E797AA|nr:phage tail tube protein [Alicyclobacillus sp. SO9]QQE80932.1 hypothetical protein GI364_11405 [Alicyclobacillus sp. SO9]